MIFQNRRQAGQKLAQKLLSLNIENPIVFALPRGGVPVAYEVAQAFQVPLDVLVVRKIGAPVNPEYGIGAIAEGGYYWIDSEAARGVGATEKDIQKVVSREFKEVERRVQKYRNQKPLPSVSRKTVIVIDDGLATGVTARVACHYLKDQGAEKVILAIPVCSERTAEFLRSEIDQVVSVSEQENFSSVGQFYEDFTQTTDEEVELLLKSLPESKSESEEVMVVGKGVRLPGFLTVPPQARGIVLFAHGSGSGRFSSRNQKVAETLNHAGFGTLLFDLLTPEESLDRENVFDIPLLASRLILATEWVREQKAAADLPIGYFGASTGGGAALWAAAEMGNKISAVVSRGGRPDLAMVRLHEVTARTLLIVGGWDEPVIDMNKEAIKKLSGATLKIIPGASHLFEEPGKLEEVSDEAVAWFNRYFHTKPSTELGMRKSTDRVVAEIKKRAKPLNASKDLKPLVEELSQSRVVMLGESSHGTHEFYEWRRNITQLLVAEHGFNFVAVEGDWPPCWELNRYIKNEIRQNSDDVLKRFNRWPTWMWANAEMIQFADELRAYNEKFEKDQKIGFYGLDVYSLFESMDSVIKQLEKINPFLAKRARLRYGCFDSYRRDERAYAKSLIHVPQGCEEEVSENLKELLRLRLDGINNFENELFDAEQNARVVANAERYYRTMIFGDEDSWNVRDRHMLDTLAVLLDRHGPKSKGIVWAHNTHIGDYRATNMARMGQVNLGGLAREKWGDQQISLVGFGTYQGQVTASYAWDGPIETMRVPQANSKSYEWAFHEVSKDLALKAFYITLRDKEAKEGVLSDILGHRAIGVVYNPVYERLGNYVPTSLAHRYDAFLFDDQTTALEPLIQLFDRRDIPETWPQGQ